MREYARIRTTIWRSRRFRALSTDDARLFYFYLHTCPHANSLGCFVLPEGYAMADLGWSADRVREAIDSLSEAGLIAFNRDENVVRIVGFLRQDAPTNEKHVRGILKMADGVPDCPEKLAAFQELAENKHAADVRELSDGIYSLWEAYGEGYRNPDTSTSTSTSSRECPDGHSPARADGGDVVSMPEKPSPKRTAEQMADIWNETCGDIMRRVGKLTDKRQRMANARFQDDLGGDLEAWRAVCQRARASPFLRGEAGNWPGADFEWCIRPNNLPKIMEGKYDPKPDNQPQQRTQPGPKRSANPLREYAGGGAG